MQPYIPDDLPLKTLDYGRLLGLVGKANAELARYDGLLQGIVNPAVMLSPLTTQEAVLSSKIEGTQATLDEVLEHEAGIKASEEKEKDIQEIFNYRKALMVARDEVAERPISLHLLRQMHTVLLDSVRGADKSPGEFRKVQNYIGKPGATIEQATFVPPPPVQVMNFLEHWQTYVQGSDIDFLIQAAITHAHFELIHPFKDGNGRIGRLLIPLFLYQKKCISAPMLYVSGYLEEHRDEYYGALRGISRDGDWNSWIEFFLNAIKEQSFTNGGKVRKIMAVYNELKTQMVPLTHSRYAFQALDTLFDQPIFDTTSFAKRSKIPRQSALIICNQLRDAGILKCHQEARGRRPAVLIFARLLNIAEGKEII